MPNQLNKLIEGITKGVLGIGSGFIEQSERKDAESLYSKGKTYIEQMGLMQTQALKNANDISLTGKTLDEIRNDNANQTDNTQLQELPQYQQQQKPQKQYSLTGLYDIIAKLGANEYGKPYAQSLSGLYEANNPKLDWKVTDTENGILGYAFDRNGKLITQKIGDKKEKWIPTTDKLYSLSQDGDKYYIKYPMTNSEGKVKFSDPLEITQEEYKNANDLLLSKSESPEEKTQRALELFSGKQNININLGLTGNKGNKGKKTSKEEISLYDQNTQNQLKNYLEGSSDLDNFKGSELDKQIKLDKLQEQRDLLKSKIPEDKIDEYLTAYRTGELTSKQLKKEVINNSKKNNYETEITFAGTKFDITRTAGINKLFDILEKYVKDGSTTIDELSQIFESHKDELPPQFITQLKARLKKYQ